MLQSHVRRPHTVDFAAAQARKRALFGQGMSLPSLPPQVFVGGHGNPPSACHEGLPHVEAALRAGQDHQHQDPTPPHHPGLELKLAAVELKEDCRLVNNGKVYSTAAKDQGAEHPATTHRQLRERHDPRPDDHRHQVHVGLEGTQLRSRTAPVAGLHLLLLAA